MRILQKKALRTIEHAKYNACTLDLRKKTNILLIDELIELELAKISFRYTHDALPKPLENLLQANDYNHNYMTRARHNPRIQPHSTNIYFNSFLRRAPSIWTNLGQNIKTKPSLPTFCKAYKKSKLSNWTQHRASKAYTFDSSHLSWNKFSSNINPQPLS